MKFSVSQTSLSTALAVVSKGLTSSTLPILSGIYVRAADGTLEFQTTDLSISVRHKIPANVDEPGAIVIPGRVLQNMVKNLAGGTVQVEERDRMVVISCGKAVFRLNTLAASDFPEFPEIAVSDSVELPRAVLSSMVDKVYKVTSKDKSRPLLQGILLTVENNVLRLVATDSYRLAVCDTHVETSSLQGSFEMIIPGAAFHDVLSLPCSSDVIFIGSTSSQVVFSFDNTTYVARRIEGTFPNFKQLLPTSSSTTVRLPLADFGGALRRASVIASTNPSIRFDVDADGQLVTLSAVSPEQGEVREEVGCEVVGNSLAIGLNYHYVADCIAAVSGKDEVTLELQDSARPGVFKSYDKINYLYLVMPVRM